MTPSRVEQTETQVRFDRLILTRFAAAVRSFASSDEGWKAKLLFGLLIAFLFAINGLNVVNSYVARDFMTAIANRDRAGFISQATLYIGVFTTSTIIAVLYRFSEDRVEDQLKRLLLGRYQAYLANGLDGIAPYARSSGPREPSAELRRATEASRLLKLTDQVAGFTSSMKKGIGRSVMAKQLTDIFERSRDSFPQRGSVPRSQ